MEASRQLMVLKPASSDYLRQVSNAPTAPLVLSTGIIPPHHAFELMTRSDYPPYNVLLLITHSHLLLLPQLATALPLGRPVLLEAVPESLDASLVPVLLKQTFKAAGSLCVKLGDQVCEQGDDGMRYGHRGCRIRLGKGYPHSR